MSVKKTLNKNIDIQVNELFDLIFPNFSRLQLVTIVSVLLTVLVISLTKSNNATFIVGNWKSLLPIFVFAPYLLLIVPVIIYLFIAVNKSNPPTVVIFVASAIYYLVFAFIAGYSGAHLPSSSLFQSDTYSWIVQTLAWVVMLFALIRGGVAYIMMGTLLKSDDQKSETYMTQNFVKYQVKINRLILIIILSITITLCTSHFYTKTYALILMSYFFASIFARYIQSFE